MFTLTLGGDIGSTTCKAVLLEDGVRVVARELIPLGTGTAAAGQVYENVLKKAGVTRADLARTVATGYGRQTFAPADRQVSELSCHAKGVHRLLPEARTVVDIGGQDAKVMRIGELGQLEEFVMNDKCAAGTGRFLDVMAGVLGVKTDQLGALSARATEPVGISSICTVFAESEVISRLAAGASLENIAAGIHISVARKVVPQIYRVGVREAVAMSGGVARNAGVVRALEVELKLPILTHPDCQLAGAYGAAILAFEDLQKQAT